MKRVNETGKNESTTVERRKKMKRTIYKLVIAGAILLTAAPFGISAEHGGHSQEPSASANNSGHGSMDHSAHQGELIHESEVDGYGFAYHLIDMRERMAGMEKMPEMKNTHHLMLYVKSPQGQMVDTAKVGYLIEGPDGKRQTAMCMAMSGGFGADVDFAHPGEYRIKTKVMSGDTKLMDGFTYEVKK